MNKSLKVAIFAILIAVVGLSCIGGYQLYQRRYLSPDLKRTLTAALDPSATEGDILVYIRDARLQVRTNKDAEVLQKFQTCIRLAKDASELNNQVFQETLSSIGDGLKCIGLPHSTQREIDDILRCDKEQLAETKRKQELHSAMDARAKSEGSAAKTLYGEVRMELGLRPLPATEQTSKGAK